MKNVRIWFLLIFLGNSCFSEPLVLFDDIDKIIVETSATVYPSYHSLPENDRIRLILNKKNIKIFIDDLNNSELMLDSGLHKSLSKYSCYEIKMYCRNKLITVIRTNGIQFYYEKNESLYHAKKNLFKYWKDHPHYEVLSEENSCL
jgi:hypothetical protein